MDSQAFPANPQQSSVAGLAQESPPVVPSEAVNHVADVINNPNATNTSMILDSKIKQWDDESTQKFSALRKKSPEQAKNLAKYSKNMNVDEIEQVLNGEAIVYPNDRDPNKYNIQLKSGTGDINSGSNKSTGNYNGNNQNSFNQPNNVQGSGYKSFDPDVVRQIQNGAGVDIKQ